jgi:hypothetical protein
MRMRLAARIFCVVLPVVVCTAAAHAADLHGIASQAFDRDPGWEGFGNRIKPQKIPTVVQDFGYSNTDFASRSAGELGGSITRAAEPAWYAAKVDAKTLDDKLSASGTFSLTFCRSGGIFFGWFNSSQRAGAGRPINSLGFYLGGGSTGGRLSVFLITPKNATTGTFVTRYERYQNLAEKAEKRPSPIRTDGTRYRWQMDYDPSANSGRGQIHFTVNVDSGKAPAPAATGANDFLGKQFTVDLPAGFKQLGTRFDRFGLMNATRPGGPTTVYFGDLTLDGRPQDFATDPQWDGHGNRQRYQAKEVAGCQDFGFSLSSNAGVKPGEIGGVVWRAPYAYYADRVGPLSLAGRLEAHGRFVLESGAPDSNAFFGWFNSQAKHVEEKDPTKDRNYLGVAIGGPTRVGHYFVPTYAIAGRGKGGPKRGPVLQQGKTYEWSLDYDPDANGGLGQMRLKLGDESETLDLARGMKTDAPLFDRFGITSVGVGGGQLKLWLDDLQYTK